MFLVLSNIKYGTESGKTFKPFVIPNLHAYRNSAHLRMVLFLQDEPSLGSCVMWS